MKGCGCDRRRAFKGAALARAINHRLEIALAWRQPLKVESESPAIGCKSLVLSARMMMMMGV